MLLEEQLIECITISSFDASKAIEALIAIKKQAKRINISDALNEIRQIIDQLEQD